MKMETLEGKCEDSLENGNSPDLKGDKQETASSGYDSCPSPSTTGSNSPGTAVEIQNEEITSTSMTKIKCEKNIEQKTNKQKKTGKTFPVLVPLKQKRISTTIIARDDKDKSSPPSRSESPPDKVKVDDPLASSSDNEVSNIALSQRLKSLKKKKNSLTRLRLKQSKADREILNATENPKPSTSGPLRREIERFRRALLAKAEGAQPPLLPNSTPPFRRIIPRNRGRPMSSPLKKSPFKIKKNGRPSATAELEFKNTPSPCAKKKLKLLHNISNPKQTDSTNTATAAKCKREMAVSTSKLEQKDRNLQEKKTEEVKVDSTVEVPEQEAVTVEALPPSEPISPPSPNQNSLLLANEVAHSDSVPKTKKKICEPTLIPIVQVQREEYIEQLLMLQMKKQNETESCESDSDSQSEPEVASEVSCQVAAESSCCPKSKPNKISVSSSSSSTSAISDNSNSNDESSQKKSSVYVKKKDIMASISEKRLAVKLERLNSDLTKSCSPPLVSTQGKNSTPGQRNNDNSGKRNSRKRKVSEDSTSDLEIDVVGCSSESDPGDIFLDLDESGPKNAGLSSRHRIVDATPKGKFSKSNTKKVAPASKHIKIKPSPKSKQTIAAAAASRRKAGPKSKMSSKKDGNYVTPKDDLYFSPKPNGFKSTAFCSTHPENGVAFSSHSSAPAGDTPPENFDTFDYGRRLSTRKKTLRFGNDWIY